MLVNKPMGLFLKFYSKQYDFVPLPLSSRYRPITVPLPFSGHRDPW
jgi:hypothetical protein